MIEFKNCIECPNIETAEPYISTTIKLFESEFSMKVNKAEIVAVEQATEVNNINLISHLSGSLTANIVFSFEKSLAKKVLDSFPYLEYDETMEDEMIIETVGEFLNIVIGHAMRNVQAHSSLHFSPPIGLTGDSKIYCGKGMQVCRIKLILDDGEMLIIFSTPKKEI